MVHANLPWVESPFFDEELKLKNLTDDQKKLVNDYRNNGYVVLKGILPESLIDEVRGELEKKGFNNAFSIKTYRDETRVQDLWQISDPVKELACFPQVLEVLQLLYEREPVPFQTLNFRVGTQQKAHSDTIHFSSLPSKFMCGVWIALEDITEDNGPLFYYPGSQRLAEYNFAQIKNTADAPSYENYKEYENFIAKIITANEFEKKTFLAKKGDLLIWSSNILHGGSSVTKEGSTRWSQVTHYFFKDCYYFTPMLSNMVTNELVLRNDLVNINTGKVVEQSYNGKKLNYFKTGRGKFIFTGNIKLPKVISLWDSAKRILSGNQG
jgi:ectoine hydroxylase-related dioxygenase (phytanoyl-CoA dioxygenase family)